MEGLGSIGNQGREYRELSCRMYHHFPAADLDFAHLRSTLGLGFWI